MYNVNEKMNIYVDRNAPSILVTTPIYFNNYKSIRKRGGGDHIRFVTDINKENLDYCKEIMNIVDEF